MKIFRRNHNQNCNKNVVIQAAKRTKLEIKSVVIKLDPNIRIAKQVHPAELAKVIPEVPARVNRLNGLTKLAKVATVALVVKKANKEKEDRVEIKMFSDKDKLKVVSG